MNGPLAADEQDVEFEVPSLEGAVGNAAARSTHHGSDTNRPPTPPLPTPSSSSRSQQQQLLRQEQHSHSSQLPTFLRVLFALVGGASLQLPTLALMSIANDRVAIPPQYLPAYGAVSFLPWSFKPLYAFLSSAIIGTSGRPFGIENKEKGRHRETRRRMGLVGVLLAAGGGAYVGTAFVPPGGVFLCFLWGFLRGALSAWPELLLGVTLIETARSRAEDGSIGGSGSDDATNNSSAGGNIQLVRHNSHGSSDSNSSNLDGGRATIGVHGGGVPELKYEDLASVFQSQAATARNAGSLVASVITFALFAYRQFFRQPDADNAPLSDAVVSGLLFATAAVNGVGSFVAFGFCYGGDAYDGGDPVNASQRASSVPAAPGGSLSTSRRLKRQAAAGDPASATTSTTTTAQYHSITTHDHEGEMLADDHLPIIESAPRTVKNSHPSPAEIDQGEESEEDLDSDVTPLNQTGSSGKMQLQQHVFDVAALAIFQILLVLAALKGPIAALTGNGVWISLIAVVVGCLSAALTMSTLLERRLKKHQAQAFEGNNDPRSPQKPTRVTIPPKRLALYLILRHSVPIAGFPMYSYVYTLFASEPVFLQVLSIVGTGSLTAATWSYERFFSKRFNSGAAILNLIAAMAVLASLVSLLDVFVVRAGNSLLTEHAGTGTDGDEQQPSSVITPGIGLHVLIFFARVASNFTGEWAFLPHVVLATTNVVSSKSTSDETSTSCCDEEVLGDLETFGLGNGDAPGPTFGVPAGNTESKPQASPVYDESMQYASFLSCIDFGSQVGDWVSVPIVAALGITRENYWANLDLFIVICALARLASISFLCIVRQPEIPDTPVLI